MRRRSPIAALAAAASVFWLGAFALPPAFAQDLPAAEEVDDDPQWRRPGNPPDQNAAADPSAEPAAAPADDAGMAATAPQEAAPQPDATPVVAALRAKFADPAFRNAAPAGDLAALEAFYNSRRDPVWTTDMGFSSEAQAAIDEILKADDWGLSRAAFDFPAAGHLPGSVDEQALSEIKLNLAILKYARHARGGRTDPDKLRNNDMVPTFRDPKLVLAEIADAPAPKRLSPLAAPQA